MKPMPKGGPFPERVIETIDRHELIAEGERVLVGVSGGPDSMALLEVLHLFSEHRGWELAVAHLHHGIRGEEADRDMLFVQKRARMLGLPFLSRRLGHGWISEARGSLEQKARHMRYAFLEECLADWGGHKIALGHHASDQVETVLASLLRGAGPRGLSGMPYRRGPIVRPLLDVSRQEIMQFLRQRDVPFRVDSTNADMTFLRNRIRHKLIPLLKGEFSAKVDDLILRTARLCMVDEEFFQQQVEEYLRHRAHMAQGIVELELKGLSKLHPAIRWRVLREAYARVRGSALGLALAHVEDMDRLVMEGSTEERWVSLPGGVWFGASANTAVMTSRNPRVHPEFTVALPVPGETEIPQLGMKVVVEQEDSSGPFPDRCKGAAEAYMDMDSIEGQVFLRGPKPGDRIRPIGLGGTKKVQDILVDNKVPRRLRWRIPIMADKRGVMWVVGMCLDERVRVRPHTKRVLRVCFAGAGEDTGARL